MGRTLGAISGQHVFGAVLGIQRAFWHSFQLTMKEAAPLCHDFEQFTAAYPSAIDMSRSGAVNCGLPQALPSLTALRSGVLEAGATFVSENFPYLTTGTLAQGIYRWKLPTVYDMSVWIAERDGPVTWAEFDEWYSAFTPADELRRLVHDAWDSGELALGTHLMKTSEADDVKPIRPRICVFCSPDDLGDEARKTSMTRLGPGSRVSGLEW